MLLRKIMADYDALVTDTYYIVYDLHAQTDKKQHSLSQCH